MKKKRPVVMFQGKLVPEEDLFYLQDLPVPKSALFVELPAQATDEDGAPMAATTVGLVAGVKLLTSKFGLAVRARKILAVMMQARKFTVWGLATTAVIEAYYWWQGRNKQLDEELDAIDEASLLNEQSFEFLPRTPTFLEDTSEVGAIKPFTDSIESMVVLPTASLAEAETSSPLPVPATKTQAAPVTQFQPMHPAVKDIHNKNYGAASADLDIAIANATKKTGINPGLLYAVAYKESRFGRLTRSRTSSAQGTFQILSSVFDGVLKKYGSTYPELKHGPKNTQAGALAAALLLRDQNASFEKQQDTKITDTDSYLLYFMGPTGGRKFLNGLRKNPNRVAAKDFRDAAKANPAVFKEKNRWRTYREVYNYLHGEIDTVSKGVHREFAPKQLPPRSSVVDFVPAPTLATFQPQFAEQVPSVSLVPATLPPVPSLPVDMDDEPVEVADVALAEESDSTPTSKPRPPATQYLRTSNGWYVELT